jgi:hypothetical protein
MDGWNRPQIIKVDMKDKVGGHLIVEPTQDGGCFIKVSSYSGGNAAIRLDKDQTIELKFWFAMNVGNKE